MRKLFLVALSSALLLIPLPASADPVDDARERVDGLQHEAEALGQDYVAARERHEAASKKLTTVKKDLTAQEKLVAESRDQAGQLALAQRQEGSISTTLRIVTSSTPDTLIHHLALIDQINASQNEKILTFGEETARLEELRREAMLHEEGVAVEEEAARESKA